MFGATETSPALQVVPPFVKQTSIHFAGYLSPAADLSTKSQTHVIFLLAAQSAAVSNAVRSPN